MARAYRLLDVFTDRPLAGNPLAVVLDGAGLDGADMQAVAAEFNLSETVFVLPAEGTEADARLRIFTPSTELPFAGHPTVGTAVCLALVDGGERRAGGGIVLDVEAGRLRCTVSAEGELRGRASVGLPILPRRLEADVDPALVADTLGLARADVGFAGHGLGVWSAGVPFLLVPLKDRDAVARAAVAAGPWPRLQSEAGTHGVFVYCRDCVDLTRQFHARMFAPSLGITEDPATGAAVAALAGQIVASDNPGEGRQRLVIEQGFEMGRPSLIGLKLVIAAGRLTAASLEGEAVVVGEGRLHL